MDNTDLIRPRILVYQDEDCNIMVDYLIYNGFQIILATEENVFDKIKEMDYDLCILCHYKSYNINDEELKLLKYTRKLDDKIPILMVSDKVGYNYIVEALNEGADDYIIRPYNINELIARIKALLRRYGIRTRRIEATYKIGDYIFNATDKILSINNIQIPLNNKQNKILSLLCAYKNEELPKKLLMQQIWSDDNYFNKRSLDVHMCALRNMLKMDSRIAIKTIRGISYSLIVNDEDNLM